MRYYQRSISIGVLVLYLISSTLSLYANENKHHGRGYSDQEREIGVIQYYQEQNNDDSMYEDFDNIKPKKSSMNSTGETNLKAPKQFTKSVKAANGKKSLFQEI